MELSKYQLRAMETCMPSCRNIEYMLLNLQGEVGELSSKIAKAIRNGAATIEEGDGILIHDAELIEALELEAGDVLWQLTGLCRELGMSLEVVAQRNLDKLASRKNRGVIDGNGDYR